MPKKPAPQEQLLLELEDLRAQLREAKETLRAIRSGEVDALVVPGVGGAQLFTLKGADHPYRMLIEEMSEGALTMTAEGVILYANRRFAETLKTPLEKVIGSTIHTWIAPDSQRILQSLLRKSVDERRREQLALTAGDGTRVPVYLSVSNLLINEMPDSFCLVATDLTEQKRREEIIVASEKLARELLAAAKQSRLALLSMIEDQKQAEETLRTTLTDLQRSNADLQQFAYVASHDLQEPLRMVASFVQLLGMNYRGRLDADADEFIGYAVEGATRMQQIILDLLEYSRVGTRGAAPRSTDATLVCQAALRDLELAITERGATVVCDPLPTVLADATQLARVFQNLIANAIKFHGAAPPQVHVSARQTFEVSETSKVSSKVWEFAVHDNGIGIAAEYFERIFVIFQRLHTRDAYPGTGIGLAICKKIVERHGGRIWVESAPGQGATFFFTLPAATLVGA